MKITADRLAACLKKQLSPIYLITGNELLLEEEAVAAIHQAAHTQGYTEHHRHTVTPQFDWHSLQTETATLSLFGEKRIFELRLSSGKPGDAGSRALQQYATTPLPETLLIIRTGKLPPQTANSAWYQAIDKIGTIVSLWPITTAQLPRFLTQRLREKELSADPQAIALLADFVDGNLLAAQQEIDKLHLLHPKGHLSFEHVAQALVDVARFDIFKLANEVLQGHSQFAIRILRSLRQENTEPTLILWALSRECRQVLSFSEKSSQDKKTSNAYFDKQKTMYQSALSRHPANRWIYFLQQAYHVDKTIKGIRKGNVWDELERLCLQITGAFYATEYS